MAKPTKVTVPPAALRSQPDTFEDRLEGTLTFQTTMVDYMDDIATFCDEQGNALIAGNLPDLSAQANNLIRVNGTGDGLVFLSTGTFATAAQGTKADAALPAASKASQGEAEAGTNDTKYMTPLKTKQAINEQAAGMRPMTFIAGGVFNGGGTPSFVTQSGFNGTVTDNTAGDYTLTFDAAEPDTNYVVMLTVVGQSGVSGRYYVHYDTVTVNGFDVHINGATGTPVDVASISVLVFRV